MLSDFVKQKAREISYALIRVSFYVKKSDFRNRLEALAVELLENLSRASANASLENMNRSFETISVLDGLVRLAHSIYEIEPVNATALVRELDSLNAAIRQSGKFSEELPNIEEFFSKVPAVNSNEVKISNISNNGNGGTGGGGINTAIRQSAIISRIRSGNSSGCRLKDLLIEFPDVSERTLRYDLQRLCEQGAIERLGNGGPASYYVIKGNDFKEQSANNAMGVIN